MGTLYLGFLHFHNRNPINTINRAIRNAIQLQQLPQNTTIYNIHASLDKLEELVGVDTLQGRDKLLEIIDYIKYNYSHFIYTPPSPSLSPSLSSTSSSVTGRGQETASSSCVSPTANANTNDNTSANTPHSPKYPPTHVIRIPPLASIIKHIG